MGGQEALSVNELAKRHQVPQEKLRKRLGRWREDAVDGWYEVADRRPRDPKYLYQEAAVLPIIQQFKSDLRRPTTGGQRPAK
jgi:hypothetical protein